MVYYGGKIYVKSEKKRQGKILKIIMGKMLHMKVFFCYGEKYE